MYDEYERVDRFLTKNHLIILTPLRKFCKDNGYRMRITIIKGEHGTGNDRIHRYDGPDFSHHYPAELDQVELIKYFIKGYRIGSTIGHRQGQASVRSSLRDLMGINSNDDGSLYIID